MLGNYVNIKGKHLIEYRYSTGGGMTGAYQFKTISKIEGHALISIESASWHNEEPVINKYITDLAVLEEIEGVVRKYKMNYWHKKKFTNMFVSDGESKSYSFTFDDSTIAFSSQIYPINYLEKLALIDEIIDKYIETSENISASVNTKAE